VIVIPNLQDRKIPWNPLTVKLGAVLTSRACSRGFLFFGGAMKVILKIYLWYLETKIKPLYDDKLSRKIDATQQLINTL